MIYSQALAVLVRKDRLHQGRSRMNRAGERMAGGLSDERIFPIRSISTSHEVEVHITGRCCHVRVPL